MLLTDTCASMLRFLSPQADERSGLLWFDYLCINQHDMAERDCQLPKMCSIYGLCTRVIVYLGDDIVQRLGPGEHRSRHWLHEIDEILKSTEDPSPLTLGDVLKRDYFKRTWVIQEILLAETVIIPIKRCNFRAGVVALNHLSNARHLIWEWKKEGAPWLQYMGQTSISLDEALRQTWGSDVTDPRDKIFGILGLVQNDPEFKPNSSLSRLSTFIGTCAHLLKRGYTELLLKSMGDGALAGQLTWLPKWTDPNLWETQDTSSLRYLSGVRRHINRRNGFPSRSYCHDARIDVICMRPGPNFPPKLPVLPNLDHLSLCSSSGTLCLRLSHLLTLKSIPIQVAEAGTLKAFNLRIKGSYPFVFITTLNGPLDTLQLSDEIFLHVDAKAQLGILFALRFQSQHDSHRLLFSCVCIDVLLITDRQSVRKKFRAGIPISRGEDFINVGNPKWFRSPLGRSMSSALRECCETRETRANIPETWTKPYQEKYLRPYAITGLSYRTPPWGYPIRVQFRTSEDELWLISQALLDDEAERDKAKKTHFLRTSQKVLQDLEPRCKIMIDGDDLVLRGNTPEGTISIDEDGALVCYGMPRFRLDISHRISSLSPDLSKVHTLFPKNRSGLKYTGVSEVRSWETEIFKIPLSEYKESIRSLGIAYHKLRSLTDFRGTNGLNETQLLKQYDEQKSENDLIYADNVWPCVENVVKSLGLVGEVKNVRIQ